ncbi:hypothetical protein VDG1235_4307 [Verrucomicrobiia bacterium DG1235]|nr:hypothetical protein VDG1235_4307 [Verrucomicrobiae bacterium DG1235]
MGKKTAIGSALILFIGLLCLFLYSRFIGFEREALATKFPSDTYAYLSIRHIRKAAIAFATDDQLKSASNVIRAIAKTLSDSAEDEDLPTLDVDIDPELLEDLVQHFKTELALAVLPPAEKGSLAPEFALATQFYGSPEDLASTLTKIASQASSGEEQYTWAMKNWNDTPTWELEINLQDGTVPFHPTWTVYQDVLYLSSNPSSLYALLEFNKNNMPTPSLADSIAKHKHESHISKPDFSLHINAQPCLDLYSHNAQRSLTQKGSMAASISLKRLLNELGLNEIDSLHIATELSGEKSSYSSVRYKDRIGLLSTISPSETVLHQYPEEMPIFSAEGLNIDTGQALLTLKNAILKAAPIANIPYFGLRSKIYSDTGLQLEDIVAEGFENQINTLHTLDTGTARNAMVKVTEKVIFDHAIKFRLREGNTISKLIDSQIPILLRAKGQLAYQEDGILFVDSDIDSSITSDRFALAYDDHYITIGRGTLKSFHTLHEREEIYLVTNPMNANSADQIGNGTLLFQNLPTTLFRLATVFYLQLNPDKGIPPEYFEFDWGALSALELERESQTYDDRQGHLYRISKQKTDQ